MTWIKRSLPGEDPAIAKSLADISARMPPEYDQARRAERRTPDIIKNDSIMLSHSLIPDAMRGMFMGYAAMLDPSLPLTRRQQEMIATTVAALNDCFY